MIIVENIITQQPENDVLASDTVSLTWEGRQKCRQRLTTASGRDIGLALPTGTILQPGDVLYRNEQFEIVVQGAPEVVFVLRPEMREVFGLVCYQIGNLHRPIGFHEGAILVPYEPVLEKQLARLGFDYTIEELVFTRAAARWHTH
jgi:urease accessory protein